MNNMQQKHIFVILGMARSGTSAITRGLKALGIDLGSQLTPGNEKWNAKGFWEDSDIVYNINGKAFAALDFQPYGINMPDPQLQTSDALNDVKTTAKELLNQRFAHTNYWGFKDPSTIKLLPFWQSLFTDLGLDDHYIIALRDPLATARSYQAVAKSGLEIGLLLWLMHITAAITETENKKRIIISYEFLLEHPKAQLQRLKQALSVPDLASVADIDFYANEFIDKDLHRHTNQHDSTTDTAAKVVPLCQSVYQLLLRAARDEISLNSPDFLFRWKQIQDELNSIYPVYCYIDTLLKKINQLERQERHLHKSIAWKMLYPLRIIDDSLRKRREKSRGAKRLSKAYG